MLLRLGRVRSEGGTRMTTMGGSQIMQTSLVLECIVLYEMHGVNASDSLSVGQS